MTHDGCALVILSVLLTIQPKHRLDPHSVYNIYPAVGSISQPWLSAVIVGVHSQYPVLEICKLACSVVVDSFSCTTSASLDPPVAGVLSRSTVSGIAVNLPRTYPAFDICESTRALAFPVLIRFLDPAVYPWSLLTVYPEVSVHTHRERTRAGIVVKLAAAYPVIDICERSATI